MARINPEVSTTDAAAIQFWRYGVRRHGELAGDGFDSGDKSPGNYAVFYAAAVAKRMPDKQVYVINISRGATNLVQWLESTSSENAENMWNAISNNVAAALPLIGNKDTIDELIWWGHESDAANKAGTSATQFRDDFLTVIDQIDNKSWGNNGSYPVTLHKIHPLCNPFAEQINFGLELLAKHLPNRIYIADTTGFNYEDNIHLDGDQKAAASVHTLETKTPGSALPQRAINPNLFINGSFALAVSDDTDTQTDNYVATTPAHWTKSNGTQLDIKNGIVSLRSGSIAQTVKGDFKARKLITVSMENLTENLTITIGDLSALMTAGVGRRQASFILRKPDKHKLEVIISSENVNSENERPATFSKAKLEHGGAYTDFNNHEVDTGLEQAKPLGPLARLKLKFL